MVTEDMEEVGICDCKILVLHGKLHVYYMCNII